MADSRTDRSEGGGEEPERSAAYEPVPSSAPKRHPVCVSPANDNPTLTDLPACLPVTDEEVRLLHRNLGPQILALFG